jgi:hypothetical protein
MQVKGHRATCNTPNGMNILVIYGHLWTSTHKKHRLAGHIGPAGLGMAGSARPASILAPVSDRSTGTPQRITNSGAPPGVGSFLPIHNVQEQKT